jgi:hypothetical protein
VGASLPSALPMCAPRSLDSRNASTNLSVMAIVLRRHVISLSARANHQCMSATNLALQSFTVVEPWKLLYVGLLERVSENHHHASTCWHPLVTACCRLGTWRAAAHIRLMAISLRAQHGVLMISNQNHNF